MQLVPITETALTQECHVRECIPDPTGAVRVGGWTDVTVTVYLYGHSYTKVVNGRTYFRER